MTITTSIPKFNIAFPRLVVVGTRYITKLVEEDHRGMIKIYPRLNAQGELYHSNVMLFENSTINIVFRKTTSTSSPTFFGTIASHAAFFTFGEFVERVTMCISKTLDDLKLRKKSTTINIVSLVFEPGNPDKNAFVSVEYDG